MRLLARIMSRDPDETDAPPFWAVPREKRAETAPEIATTETAVNQALAAVPSQPRSAPTLIRALSELVKAARRKDDPMGIPLKPRRDGGTKSVP